MTRATDLTRRLGALTLLALLGLASSGCGILYKRTTYHFDPTFSPTDPQFLRSLDAFGTQMQAGNAVEVLENGDQTVPAMLAAIAAAKRTVDLEQYIFKDDRAGAMFAEALMAAARRGVEVRVLLDGTGGTAGKYFVRMQQAGVRVRVYRAPRITATTHRKLLVVDGAVGFTGGMGIDHRWLGNARNAKEWRDIQARAEGPVAAQMQIVFAEDWTYTTGEILAGERFYPPLHPVGDQRAQMIKVSVGDPSSFAKMLYYVAIQSATRSIHIENAYFLPDAQVRAALVAAAKRGVDVEVEVPGSHNDVPFIRMASRRHYGELLQGGVKIYEYIGTMLHSKTLVVDGIFSTVGSINLDQRSMTKQADESLSVYDPVFAARLEEVFRADLAKSRQITYRSWKSRGVVTRIGELLSSMWEPVL